MRGNNSISLIYVGRSLDVKLTGSSELPLSFYLNQLHLNYGLWAASGVWRLGITYTQKYANQASIAARACKYKIKCGDARLRNDVYFLGIMPPKKRLRKEDHSGTEQPDPPQTRSTRQRASRNSEAEQARAPEEPVVPNIDYELLAKHIVQLQKANAAPVQGKERPRGSQSTKQPTASSHSSAADNRNSQTVQADTCTGMSDNAHHMVPASALGPLLDEVFSGEPAGSTSSNNSMSQLTDCVPLGATVSAKLKNKIWSNEFVDLRMLLPNSNESISVMVKAGKIELQQASANKTPLSIHLWTDAFLIFSNIFLQKFPHEASNLLKYMYTVREISRLHGEHAWRMYDEEFRRIRETSFLPWEKIVPELRLKSASMGFKMSTKPQGGNGKNQAFRSKPMHCFRFNKGQKCFANTCKYSHTCQECNGPHPRSQCTGTRANSSPSYRKDGAPSNSSKPDKPTK